MFAYPVTDASVTNTAKVIIDIMSKHTYLPTSLITDKGRPFTSKLVAEIAQILAIQLKCATIKHPQTIGKLERTHASLKTNRKMASGEYGRQWHKYLPLAVLNCITSYHASLRCEPSRIFHGRIPYNILDHKLGFNRNPKVLPTTDFAARTHITRFHKEKHHAILFEIQGIQRSKGQSGSSNLLLITKDRKYR